MKIETRIKSGKLKGWTIRKSKDGWYALYASNGTCQSLGKRTLDEVKQMITAIKSKNPLKQRLKD